MHTIFFTEIQFGKRFANPSRLARHHIIGQMQVARKQTTRIFRLLLAHIFRPNVTRTQVLEELTFYQYGLSFQLTRQNHHNHQQQCNTKHQSDRHLEQSCNDEHHKRYGQQYAQHNGSYQRRTVSTVVIPQCNKFHGMVFLDHDGPQERSQEQNRYKRCNQRSPNAR